MSKKILLVEDEEAVRVLLKLLLSHSKYDLLEADNGLEGLGLAKQYKPDMIITDLSMPIMDGVTFIKMCKADESLKKIPIVALTGTQAEFQKAASDAGANVVMTKPILRRELLRIVSSMLA